MPDTAMSPSQPVFLLEQVHRQYQVAGRRLTALSPLSASIDQGEFLAITGPSGSGKSTLLNLLSGLDRPSGGDIRYLGEPFSDYRPARLAHIRNREFGFIFQTPHLLPDRTVIENVALPFRYAGGVSGDPSPRCRKLLDYVGLGAFYDRFPATLSGGEMQRVVFARALVLDPKVIFADEPTGSLDADNSRLILDLLAEQTDQGRTVVMVTHDADAVACARRRLTLHKAQHG
jgi:putative ABC transport system ATP-binding protein